ncbi:MAG: YggS family pyridoxal phosphate-dependent enzyme [Oscillospiraceae bacterium]|jgi:pyridoxal phosphate enzyme (YggS family)|nr:YggS family pyridoxal phosphate-dependent enzyme [Oscillospiraceae bacterium]
MNAGREGAETGVTAENVRRVRELIASAARAAGRAAEDITLVAAAKQNGAASVREAIAAGVDAVGENRVQEMTEKLLAGAYEGAPLHFIGHLQTNKVRFVVGACALIESADSPRLVEEIGKRAVSLGIAQDILLEVNIGREPGKSGVLPENLTETLEKAASTRGIFVRGLMAVPPALAQNKGNRRFFDDMMKLFVDIRGKTYDNVDMRYLSMGMSDSFREAVLSGANMVRIGSAIFGLRKY